MRWEKAIKNIKKCDSSAGSGSGFGLDSKRSNVANLTGKLGAPDTINALKQQSNNTQGAATHSGLLSKKTQKSDTILPVISLFLLRSNNSLMQTSQ